MKLLSICFIFSLVLISCLPASHLATAQTGLAHSQWLLQNLSTYPEKFGLITLEFQSSQFSGSDGCNRIFGPYSQTGAAGLTIPKHKLATTLIACPEPAQRFSKAYTDMLGKVQRFKIGNNQLHLLDAQGQVLASYTAQQTQLGGSEWTVSGLNNGKGAVTFDSPSHSKSIRIAFGINGKITGQVGCNAFSGQYLADQQSMAINFGELQMRKQSCPAVETEEQALLLNALRNSSVYKRSGNTLELRSADGALQAALQLSGDGNNTALHLRC